MFTIHLNNLIFHAYHGLYKEEKVLGNDFEVNVEITFDVKQEIININQTVDYVSIHSIIKKVMDSPTELIETVVQEIASQIKLFDTKITSIKVSVKKLNPAVASFIGTVGISYTQVF